MANQETNVTNGAESTLSASLSLGATTVNVTDTSSFPAVNFYAVIDPDKDAKREVVLATSKTGTTLTITRGQDGSSDVAHDSGAIIAVVPVAAHFTDINDRVEAHAHSGGTDGAAIATADLTGHDRATHDALALDHGSLSGKSDLADHGQYVHTTAQVKNTGTQAITDGTETTLTLDETDWSANCTLASDALTVTYGGRFRVYATVDGESTTQATSGTFRLKVNGITQLSVSTLLAESGGGKSSSGGTLGSNTVVYGVGVETLPLSDGDSLTLTLEQNGGSGHETSSVRLAVERIG